MAAGYAISLPSSHRRALLRLTDALAVQPADQPILWALTGSTGLALQGMSLIPHDIDVQTDAEGFAAIAELLAGWLVEPAEVRETAVARSLFAVLAVDGVKVELIGELQMRGEDGRWGPAVDLDRHRRFVSWAGRSWPVLDLAHEAEGYARLGRTARAAEIRAFLKGSA